MKISKITANFDADIALVWSIVTNNENAAWRSDLDHIEIQDDTHFIEYTKQGFPTYFTITEKKEQELYRFEMKNKNLTGKWQGKFFSSSPNETCVEFIEEISFNNFLLKIVGSFMNIKKIQETYINDLKKEIKRVQGENSHG